MLAGMPRRFPTSDKTRKGNFAEIVLAEYLIAATPAELPVYRLRHNTNIEQSMKGDDVLAFDLDANPVRIIVGEAKFRGTPNRDAVESIVDALERSNKGGLPTSLQFVADQLFDEGKTELGARVNECAELFIEGRLQLDYAGFLLSTEATANAVRTYTPNGLRRLVMISANVSNPSGLVDDCFRGLE